MDVRGGIGTRMLAAMIASVVAALMCLLLASSALADDDDDDGGEFVPRQIVVALKPGTGSIDYINRKYRTRTIEKLPGADPIYLLLTPPGASPLSLSNTIERVEANRVLYAEPNFRAGSPEGSGRMRARPGGIPEPFTDPAPYRSQNAVGRLGLAEAHGVNRGAGSIVAVVDTGVQANHRELAGRVLPGYDFVDRDANPADVGNNLDEDRDGVKDESVGHGTHVAGIVALAAPGARIVPVRALDSEGRGTTFGVARAITYALGRGADVVNLSLGSSRQSDLLDDLIDDDDDDDGGTAVFVAAAGNDGNTAPQYPAAEDDAIAVSSVNGGGKKSGFANYGGWVTVAAPGDLIYSPFPTGRYAKWSGTSMATPFVAGQAALIRSLRPTADAECVTDVIRTTSRSLIATDPTYGSRLGGHADLAASTRYARDLGCPSEGDD